MRERSSGALGLLLGFPSGLVALRTDALCRSLATCARVVLVGGGYTATFNRSLNFAAVGGGRLNVGDDGAEPLEKYNAAGSGE